MSKYRQPAYHVVRFNLKRNPDLIPWLKAQHSEPESLAQLIRLAQAMSGNNDWLREAPTIEGNLLLNPQADITQNTSNKNEINTHKKHQNIQSLNNNNNRLNKSSNHSDLHKDLRKNGFHGF